MFFAFIRSGSKSAFDVMHAHARTLSLSLSFSFLFLFFFCESCYAMRRSKIEEGSNDDDDHEKWHAMPSRNWTRTRRPIS